LSIKVGINGYGTIGKRIADAISKFKEFKIIGIVKTKPDYAAYIALNKGYNIYTLPRNTDLFREKGIEVSGTIEDLLREADLVIDATPGGYGAKYKELYLKYNVPAIFQGGEKPGIAEISFNAICNYEETIGKKYVRVVSCNTTGLSRIICLLNEEFGVRKVRATIVRRGADPKEDKRGPINSIKLDPPSIPSHHALDVKTIIPWLDIETVAVAVPTTLAHLHVVRIYLKQSVSRDRVIEALSKTKRIMFIDANKTNINSTAKLVEYMRDLGRYRYDFPENIVWLDSLKVSSDEVLIIQAIHQESIVIPENIDAVKAMFNLESDKWKAVKETDEVLELIGGVL